MSKGSVWVIASEYNDYDQHGVYLEEVYKERPTAQQVEDFLIDCGQVFRGQSSDYLEKRVNHLLEGGGRIDSEHVWYMLYEVALK